MLLFGKFYPANIVGQFLRHCHVSEHVDNGMMMSYHIGDAYQYSKGTGHS
jgi:hypothetical protein